MLGNGFLIRHIRKSQIFDFGGSASKKLVKIRIITYISSFRHNPLRPNQKKISRVMSIVMDVDARLKVVCQEMLYA